MASSGSGVPIVAAASVGGCYWLLVHYSGVAVDLAVQHGPRLAAQAVRASASGARAVAPFLSEAASQSWRAAIWTTQCGVAAVCAFWEWAKYSVGLHYRRQSLRRLVRSMEAGKFILISRGGEWDEVWIAAQVPGYVGATLGAEWIVRSTDDNVTRFIWCHVSLTVGAVMPVTGEGAARRAPAGVAAGDVNWLCDPASADQGWQPGLGEGIALAAEGRAIADHVASLSGPTRVIAGSGLPLQEVPAGAPPAALGGGLLWEREQSPQQARWCPFAAAPQPPA